MNLVKEKAAARINEIAELDLPPKKKVLRLLLEIVPTAGKPGRKWRCGWRLRPISGTSSPALTRSMMGYIK
ncbi:hypothetical protein HMSSN036_57730 [Paenibacillus macerans]|nr:hypothetical protein HMSSN036_57730 [Paenibacillus macerans]